MKVAKQKHDRNLTSISEPYDGGKSERITKLVVSSVLILAARSCFSSWQCTRLICLASTALSKEPVLCDKRSFLLVVAVLG